MGGLVSLSQLIPGLYYSKPMMEKIVGENSVMLAEEVMDKIDRTIYDRLEEWQAYAHDTALLAAVRESNLEFGEMENAQAYIDVRDKEWTALPPSATSPFINSLLANALSAEMRKKAGFYREKYGYDVFGEVFITNLYGANIAQTDKTSDFYQADEDWWQKAKEDGYYIGDVNYDSSAGIYSVDICVRVDDEQGNFLGVIKAVWNIAGITNIIEDRGLRLVGGYEAQNTAKFKLLTGDGKIIYSTEPFSFLEDVSKEDFFARLSGADQPGFFVAAEENAGDKKSELFAYARSQGFKDYKGFSWILVVENEAATVFASIYRNIKVTLTIIVFGTSASIILAAFFVYWFVIRPVSRLDRIAQDIAAGDLSKRAETGSKDEIGQLADSFNLMADGLVKTSDYVEQIIRMLPTALIVIDGRGRIKTVNKMTQAMLGYKKRELLGRRIEDIFTPVLLKKLALGKLDESTPIDNVRVSLDGKNGEKIPVLLSASLLTDRKRKTNSVVLIAKDTREMTEYAKKRLSAIMPILQKVALGDFSENVEIPKQEDEFTEHLVALNLMIEDFQEMMEEIEQKSRQLDKQNGELAETSSRLAQAKDRVETILHSIGDGVFVVDSHRRIIVFNEMAVQLSGYGVGEAMGQRYDKVLRFVYESTGQINDKFIADCLGKGIITEMANHTLLVRKNGEKMPVADSAAPLKDRDGKVIGCAVVFRDVTLAREVDRMKSEFVSLASHQLRTPLTAIKLFSEMLMTGNTKRLTKEQKEYLGFIQASTERMVTLVGDLLNVSRLETGRLSVEPKSTEPVGFIKSIISESRVLADEKGCRVKFDNPPADLPKIPLDRNLTRQVVANLIANAIRYSSGKKCDIAVKLERKDKDYVISVRDGGIGIPKAAQTKIFEKFFRADNAQKVESSGSGLGLYLSHMIMKTVGGRIWFESEEGKGSTFYVSIPARGMKKKAGERGLAG